MATSFQCDYCRTTIDTSSDASLIVHVHRKVDDDEWADTWYSESARTVYRYCSQAHLAAHMERDPLPPPVVDDDEDDESFASMAGCWLLTILIVALLAGAAYGLLELVRDVF